MTYLEDHELIAGAFYHCVTYNNEDIVAKYYGGNDSDVAWGSDLDWTIIRYVIARVPDLVRPTSEQT